MKNKSKLVALALIGSLFFACNKEDANTGSSVSNQEKSIANAKDAELISVIKNQQMDQFDKIDFLLENSLLSDNVLKEAISNNQISNVGLEVLLIVNSPLTADVTSHLISSRSNFKHDGLLAAKNKTQKVMEFIITNGSTPSIVFGSGISWAGNENCSGNCSSKWSINGFLKVNITNEEPHDFFAFNPCKEGNKRWFCGDMQDQVIDQTGAATIISILCTNSEKRCVRRRQSLNNL